MRETESLDSDSYSSDESDNINPLFISYHLKLTFYFLPKENGNKYYFQHTEHTQFVMYILCGVKHKIKQN